MYSCSSIEYWTGSLLGTPVKTLHLDITYSVHVLYGLVSVYLYSLYESLTVIFYSLFFYLFWTLLWVSHHVTQPHSSPYPFVSTLCPLDLPCKRKLKKKRKLKTINKTKHRKHLSVEAIAHHRVSYSLPFCPHIFFLAKVHRNESLVWFEVSGFKTGSSPGLLSIILLLPRVMETLPLWICRTCPLAHSTIS